MTDLAVWLQVVGGWLLKVVGAAEGAIFTTGIFTRLLNLPLHIRKGAKEAAIPGQAAGALRQISAMGGNGKNAGGCSRQHDQQRFCDEYPDQTETGCTSLGSASSSLGIGLIKSTVGCVALISGKPISAIDQSADSHECPVAGS